MSTVNAKNFQVGTSGTAAQNFTLYQPASPDGTVRLGVGNAGATTLDVASFSSAGLDAAGLAGNIAAARITNALNASGSAPIYACRAWVNFNGTGTVAIRASGNVSSISDNGTGNYTVNFTTAMPDANYSIASSVSYSDAGGANRSINDLDGGIKTTTAVQFLVQNSSGVNEDPNAAYVQIFR